MAASNTMQRQKPVAVRALAVALITAAPISAAWAQAPDTPRIDSGDTAFVLLCSPRRA